MKSNLLKRYYDNSFTHCFLLGFIDSDKRVKAGLFNNITIADLEMLSVEEKPSSGSHSTFSVRYRPNRKQVIYIRDHADHIFDLMSLEQFEEYNNSTYNNRGFAFESICNEKGIITLNYEKTDFRYSPDGYINDRPVQLKFGGRYNGSEGIKVNTAATITTEKELDSMGL